VLAFPALRSASHVKLRYPLSVFAVAFVVTSSGCGSDVSFSDRPRGGAGMGASSGAGPAGMGGTGGRGAAGAAGKGGANTGGTAGSSIMCVAAACAACACEAQACAMDAGCSAIHACAVANGCQSDFCVAERCAQELVNAGGPESEAANKAIAVTVCGAFHACGCVELGSSAVSCTGTRPSPVVDVRCDNAPACSSRDLQFCCLQFGCFDVQSECPTTSVLCDGPEDCIAGQLCCGKANAAGTYSSLGCSYSSLGCNRMCHVGDDSACSAGAVCAQSPSLPSGIGYCVVPL